MVAVTQPTLDETATGAQFGLTLTTNRGPDAHGKLTENVPSVDLSQIVPTSDLVIHPDDAKRRDVVTGDRVRIASAYGTMTVTALVSEKTQPGLVHLDFDVAALAIKPIPHTVARSPVANRRTESLRRRCPTD